MNNFDVGSAIQAQNNMITFAPDNVNANKQVANSLSLFSSSSSKRKLNYINEIIYQKLGGSEVFGNDINPNSEVMSNQFTNIESSMGKNNLMSLLIGDDEELLLYEDFKSKKNNISNLINELNKRKKKNTAPTNRLKMNQSNSLAFNTQSKAKNPISILQSTQKEKDAPIAITEKLNENSNNNNRVLLDFAEVKGIKITASKINSSANSVNDFISLNMGLSRLNLSGQNLKHAISVLSSYEKIMKLLFKKVVSKVTSINEESPSSQSKTSEFSFARDLFIKESYDLKCLISAKSKRVYDTMLRNKEQFAYGGEECVMDYDFNFVTDNIKEYSNYLEKEIQAYDKTLLSEGKYEVNYLFNILHKSRIEVVAGIKDVLVVFYNIPNKISKEEENKVTKESNAKDAQIKLLGKMLLPNPTFKFKISPQKIYFSFNENEIEYFDLESWRKIVIFALDTLEEKLKKVQEVNIKPFIKQYLKQQELDHANDKTEYNQCVTEEDLMQYHKNFETGFEEPKDEEDKDKNNASLEQQVEDAQISTVKDKSKKKKKKLKTNEDEQLVENTEKKEPQFPKIENNGNVKNKK